MLNHPVNIPKGTHVLPPMLCAAVVLSNLIALNLPLRGVGNTDSTTGALALFDSGVPAVRDCSTNILHVHAEQQQQAVQGSCPTLFSVEQVGEVV
jgi:hypothetical protein